MCSFFLKFIVESSLSTQLISALIIHIVAEFEFMNCIINPPEGN